MSLWTIIPVKPLRDGKSRLSGVLSDDERLRLVTDLFKNTLKVLKTCEVIENLLVVSKDEKVLKLASKFGASTLRELPGSDMNSALKSASAYVLSHNSNRILILPSDLPLLLRDDINAFIQAALPSPSITIAPDRRQDGTNALFLSPPGGIDFQFGPGSYQKHIDQSRQKGLGVQVFHSWSLGLDLDLPDDLEAFRRIVPMNGFMSTGEYHG